MRYPHFLPENGTIGFVAPAFGCNIEPYYSAFQNALKTFAEKGYHTKTGPNCFEGSGIGISSTPEKCAEEFMNAWQDPESDILMSCGGGELMCEILPFIDFERLKSTAPKWFQGYSDNTNLAFLLATLCDTAAVYGPCAPAFGMEPWHPAISDSFSLLNGDDPGISALNRTAVSGADAKESPSAAPVFHIRGYDAYELESLKDEEHPLAPYHATEPSVRRLFFESAANDSRFGTSPDARDTVAVRPGSYAATQSTRFSGRLIGGCLDILCMLCGTKYDQVSAFNDRYADDGIIWFMESCDLNVMSIRRALWQLDQAGWFSHVKGFLIGRPLNGGEMFGLDKYEAVTGVLKKYHVPILMDLDIGHIPPMMPLIEGSMADVMIAGNDLLIKMTLQ